MSHGLICEELPEIAHVVFFDSSMVRWRISSADEGLGSNIENNAIFFVRYNGDFGVEKDLSMGVARSSREGGFGCSARRDRSRESFLSLETQLAAKSSLQARLSPRPFPSLTQSSIAATNCFSSQ